MLVKVGHNGFYRRVPKVDGNIRDGASRVYRGIENVSFVKRKQRRAVLEIFGVFDKGKLVLVALEGDKACRRAAAAGAGAFKDKSAVFFREVYFEFQPRRTQHERNAVFVPCRVCRNRHIGSVENGLQQVFKLCGVPLQKPDKQGSLTEQLFSAEFGAEIAAVYEQRLFAAVGHDGHFQFGVADGTERELCFRTFEVEKQTRFKVAYACKEVYFETLVNHVQKPRSVGIVFRVRNGRKIAFFRKAQNNLLFSDGYFSRVQRNRSVLFFKQNVARRFADIKGNYVKASVL